MEGGDKEKKSEELEKFTDSLLDNLHVQPSSMLPLVPEVSLFLY